jgi:nitrogen fixation NifU-like protein
MSDLTELYQDLIRDHSKKPRNLREIESATRKLEGYNPLCGDRFTVYLDLDGEIIKDISFKGTGCAISTASASMMTQMLKGKSRSDAGRLFKAFRELLTADDNTANEADLGKLMVFSGVRKFPVRVKCATLAWHTLNEALHGENHTVSTEE